MSRFPVSDHCDGERFFNPSGQISKTFGDFLKWQLNGQRKLWPTWVENRARPLPAATTGDDDLVLTFINHVTFLIQTAGLNILTDPVFSQRVSPSQRIGPKRVRAPGLAFQQLPRIDLVLVSHNHYDHMDVGAIAQLEREFHPRFITPLGNGAILKSAGAAHVQETDWWDKSEHRKLRLTTVPARHWSGRGLRDRNLALWAGFVMETPRKKIYFAGDTGYGSFFKQIRERIGVVDIALLPIGAYEPRWFMREQHMNPDDAVLAHLDLEAKLSIGMHFGAFQLTDEGFDEPVKDLEAAKQKHRVNDFSVLEVGETKRF